MALFHRARAHFVLLALASSVLVRCSCEEDPVFIASAVYEPADTLNFGEVAVDQEKTLDLEIISNGSAGYKLSQYNFPAAAPASLAKFRFEGQPCSADAACTALKPGLADPGIRPGETSSVTVTYRPCPDAWDGDVLKADYDYSMCSLEADQVDMAITDNSREQGRTIVIAAQPAQRPSIQIICNRSGQQCNQALNPDATECTSLSFGSVTAGDPPCDIEIEVRNVRRMGKPTGALHVPRMDLYVAEVNAGQQVDGQSVGFSILDGAAPVVLPLEVPLPVGAPNAGKKLKVRFDGTGNGVWTGAINNGRGLRIYHDDPDMDRRPLVSVTVSAIGAAPSITVLPQAIDYGPVEQNTTRTATIVIGNAGDAILNVRDIQVRNDPNGARFVVETDQGGNARNFMIPPNTTSGARVYVKYTPITAGQDRDELVITSNDMNHNPIVVPLSGGATPRIRLDPPDFLVFELPNPPPPPPAPPRSKIIHVTNVGYGDLVIQQLDLEGIEVGSTSLDDFTVTGCSSFPCPINRTLCPPSNPACTMSSMDIEVTYRNINDNSSLDVATLKVYSTDPANPFVVVTLSAEDRPCLAPTGVITIESAMPTEGSEVCVNCNASSAGGPVAMPSTIARCDWAFAFANPIPALTPNPGPRTCFTPEASGLHILSLTVTNECGAVSSAATETIPIRSRM